MKKLSFSILAMICGCAAMLAQSFPPLEDEDMFFGVTFGSHHSYMHISDIDKQVYPDIHGNTSAIFSIFFQKYIDEEKHFSVRPEFAFLNRGGGIKNIMKNKEGYYLSEGIKDILYGVKGHYVDVRVPLMYHFMDKGNLLRPYAYLAPVFGFNSGGYVESETRYFLPSKGNGYTSTGMHLDASKANMKPFYFAFALGIGANYTLNIGGNPVQVGAEIMSEFGLTNTYGKDADALYKYPVVGNSSTTADVKGSRKYNGLEFKLTVGVPFSVFRDKDYAPCQPEKEIVYVEKIVEKEVYAEPDRGCYSLEEINDMMIRGESVIGKTICAIDDAINFEFDKSVIKPSSYEYLNRLAETLKRTNAKIMVKGHTDNMGSEEYNLNLSKERAMSVMNYLIDRGVRRENLSYNYYGMSQPIADNNTEAGRRMNRRVEFEIMR